MIEPDDLLKLIEELKASVEAQQSALRSLQPLATGSLASGAAAHIAITSIASELQKTHGLDCAAVAKTMRELTANVGDEQIGLADAVRVLADLIENPLQPEPDGPNQKRIWPRLVTD